MKIINVHDYMFGENKRKLLEFNEFLNLKPENIFKNIFNIVSDMITFYIGEGEEECPSDKENIGYLNYNMDKMFIQNQIDPFFSDRLFANRFVKKFRYIDGGSRQNKIYVFRGPPGSGKSTFLNCFISKIEEYVNTIDEGKVFEVVWKLDDALYPCPSHDNPLLMVPEFYRKDIIKKILYYHPTLKEKIFYNKSYEWIFNSKPCNFCSSVIQSLLDKEHDPLSHLYVRQYKLNRKRSEGINIFNPNDEVPKFKILNTKKVQDRLDDFFKDTGSDVSYDHSIYAKSNNGIYALMDLNTNNNYRLSELKGLTSEGIHRVNNIEEQVNSIFLIVTNPEDEKDEEDKALEDRKNVINMNYILVPQTQVKVFEKIYGKDIKKYFQPGIIENFSKILIHTRMKKSNHILKKWLSSSPEKYKSICDEEFSLLKMEIYSGVLPEWITQEDRKNFTAERRKEIIEFADKEGKTGLSDREAIELFGEFLNYYKDGNALIDFRKLSKYCMRINKCISERISSDFIDSIEKFYTYSVLQQIKESMFNYNYDDIKRILLNYLHSLNYTTDEKITVPSTGDEVEITETFYRNIEKILNADKETRERIYKKYLTETLLYDNIEETPQFKRLYDDYMYNLKENVLDKFIVNDNFRNAIKEYGTKEFDSFDNKIKKGVNDLIKNMVEKYEYTEQGAKEICVWIIDKIEKTRKSDAMNE